MSKGMMMRKIYFLMVLFLFAGMIYSQETNQSGTTAPEQPKEQQKAEQPAPPPSPSPETPKETAEKEQPVEKPAPVAPAKPAAAPVSEEARLLAQVEANSKNPAVYNYLMLYYANLGKHKERLKIALRAIQNIGGSANLYLIVGDENKFLGDFSKALISYQFALKILPADPNIYNRIGLVLLKLSNFNQAEAAFKASVFFGSAEAGATKGVFYNNLGVAYEAMHDLKNAYKNFQISLKYYPGYTTASDNLVRVRDNLKSAGMEIN
jgi:tetratricopeptide (TPR) repeat protein